MRSLIAKILPKFIKEKAKGSLYKQFGFLNVTRPYIIQLLKEDRFKDLVAVVTGGSGEIGRSICCRLAAEGAIVYVCGMTEEKMNSVVNEITGLDGRAYSCKLNVLNDENINDVFDRIIQEQGQLDILVTSAGGSSRENHAIIPEQDISVIDNVLNINLRGTILCARKAAKQMMKQEGGKIITLSSTIGCRSKASFSDYAAAKAGVIRFSESLAMELGKYGINVNCVSPGIVQRGHISHQKIEALKKTNYLNTYGKPEDVSNMVAYLVSEEASFITGQNFIVDGGRSLGLKGD